MSITSQIPAHVQAFLVDQRLKLVQETWNQLPEAIKAGITAMVQAAGGGRTDGMMRDATFLI